MNRTENYQLPQWVKEDRIMMEDFNDAMGKLDKGLAEAVAGTAELKSQVEADGGICRIAAGSFSPKESNNVLEVGFKPYLLVFGCAMHCSHTDWPAVALRGVNAHSGDGSNGGQVIWGDTSVTVAFSGADHISSNTMHYVILGVSN